jgi:hypothetical protein
MTKPFTIERVQALRRLTRAVADLLRDDLTGYLSTLSLQFRPRGVLGQYIQGSEKDLTKGADRAFRDLQALYDSVSRAQPFSLARSEVRSPIDLASYTPELDSVEYQHEVKAGADTRSVTVRSPLSWVISYAGYGPGALPDLLAHRSGANEDLQRWLLHQLVMHSVVSNQKGLMEIFERLHFPITFGTAPGFGLLPLVRVSSLSTERPPDDVIMQSVQLSGMDAFEEIINVEDIARMGNPLKDRLIALARSHGETTVGS